AELLTRQRDVVPVDECERPLRGYDRRDAVGRRFQHRTPAGDSTVLLGDRCPREGARHTLEAHAVTAREHDGPAVAGRDRTFQAWDHVAVPSRRGGHTMIGAGMLWTTRRATLPSMTRRHPVRPCVVSTTSVSGWSRTNVPIPSSGLAMATV